jgi:hypothetical protein
METNDDRFTERVWLPIWEAAWNYRRPAHGRRLLRVFGGAVASWLIETSDDPVSDWATLHDLLGLPIPPLPGGPVTRRVLFCSEVERSGLLLCGPIGFRSRLEAAVDHCRRSGWRVPLVVDVGLDEAQQVVDDAVALLAKYEAARRSGGAAGIAKVAALSGAIRALASAWPTVDPVHSLV